MATLFRTVVTAAGKGARLGEDKALVEIGDRTAIERIVDAHRRANVESVLVVRREGAAALPPIDAEVAVANPDEMIDSVRAGVARPGDHEWVVIHPVDYALVDAEVVQALCARCEMTDAEIVLPLCGGRPGHPIALRAHLEAEILDPATRMLRDVISRDRARVDAVDVTDPWIHRDIDEPHDLAAARAFEARPVGPVTAIMRSHRSRRRYRDVPVSAKQLRWIVDSARHCATSSLMQAYAVIAVRDHERKAAVAELCSDQEHIRQASVFLAVCADLHKIQRACDLGGLELQGDSLEVFLQATIDAAIFGQNIQLAAESEGLGACMIGAARNHPVELAALLELPPRVFVAFGMTLGWPADDPIPRGRMPLGAVLHDEVYAADRIDSDLEQADETMRAWAKRTNAERGGFGGRPVDESKGWSDRMARLWGRPKPAKGRAELGPALRALGFGLRVDGADDQ